MATKFNLPEKEYFTREEIAKRWGCETELVDYYVNNGLLREALYTPRGFFDLQCCSYYRCDASTEPFLTHRDQWFLFDSFNELLEARNESIGAADIVNCPTFAYLIDSSNMLNFDFPLGDLTREDMENEIAPSSAVQFKFLAGPKGERYIPVSQKKGDVRRSGVWYFEKLILDSDFTGCNRIIPREERDRFENGSPIGVEDSLGALHDSTSSMTPTTETGYLITIGMLAAALGDADNSYVKPDGNVNVKGMAKALESANMSLDGHRMEALKKRISSGLKTLKDLT